MPKQFTEEFKRQAVDLYQSTEGATLVSIATDLGISKSTLSSWVQKYRPGTTPSTRSVATHPEGDTSQIEALIAENKALQADKTRLETERDILRQAAKYFAGEMTW